MLNRFSILIAIVAIAALALAAGAMGAVLINPQPAVAQTTEQRELTVVGTGRVTAAPDTAIVQFGVQNTATTAKQALADNTTTMDAVVARLQGLGIAAKDIQTSNLSIWPLYSDPGPPQHLSGYRPATPCR